MIASHNMGDPIDGEPGPNSGCVVYLIVATLIALVIWAVNSIPTNS